MTEIPVSVLAEVLDTECPEGLRGRSAGGVSIDSRTVRKGEAFFAITGSSFDGHDFTAKALKAGAECAVAEKALSGLEDYVLRVADTVSALGRLAAWYRKQNSFSVVGITGSAGKTTVREMIYHVLKGRLKCCQSPANYNNHLGLPLTVLNASGTDDAVIAELGTSGPGEIRHLAGIAGPDIALITGVFPAHLEGLGSLKGIAREKTDIAEGLQPGGELIINGDCRELVDECRRRGLEYTSFGLGPDCDVSPEAVRLSGFSGRFELEGVPLDIPLPGAGNIQNVLAAWCVCRRFGLSLKEFAASIASLRAASMRCEVIELDSFTVINDCYNASPVSMKNALEVLAAQDRGRGRRVFFCGDMAELGCDSALYHSELASYIRESGIELLAAVGEQAGRAAEALLESGAPMEIKSFPDADSARNNVREIVQKSDIILVKGSRSAGLEAVVDELKQL